jgi:hypothetical protein
MSAPAVSRASSRASVVLPVPGSPAIKTIILKKVYRKGEAVRFRWSR